MKKILKIIGYILVGLILILITSALLIRFVFKEQMIAYTSKLEEKERHTSSTKDTRVFPP